MFVFQPISNFIVTSFSGTKKYINYIVHYFVWCVTYEIYDCGNRVRHINIAHVLGLPKVHLQPPPKPHNILWLAVRRHFFIIVNHRSCAAMNCPHCGAQHVIKSGFKVKLGGLRRQRWQCQTCGKNFMTNLDEAKPEASTSASLNLF